MTTLDYNQGYKRLREFILSEMQLREMSARQFADFVGVAHTTINRCLRSEDGNPSVDFIFKLSEATGVDVTTIMNLMNPGIKTISPSPEVMILAKRFATLPENVQTVIKSLVFKDF